MFAGIGIAEGPHWRGKGPQQGPQDRRAHASDEDRSTTVDHGLLLSPQIALCGIDWSTSLVAGAALAKSGFESSLL